MRFELVAFVGSKGEARRAALMALPHRRSWRSVIEDFVRHRDRKYTFDSEGQVIRRHILVRAKNLVGIGKAANPIGAARVLGQAAVGGRAKTYVVPNPLKGSATEFARRLGVSRRTVFYRWRRASPKTDLAGYIPGRRSVARTEALKLRPSL